MRKTAKPLANNFRRPLKFKLLTVAGFFCLFAAGIAVRLFHLQIVSYEKLLAQSKKQHNSSVSIHYGRGTIFDRNLNELARNIEVQSVYVNPQEILDPKTTAQKIADALNKNPDEVYKLIRSDRHFVWIKRKCSLKEAEKLRRMNLPGVGFVSEQKRFYPKRQLAASVTGFVGMDNQGLAGIEHYHHKILKGTTVRQVMAKDARGRLIGNFDEYARLKNKSHDVVLTIDEVIQFITEYQLKKQMEKYRAKAGIAVVMDPFTGEIYSLVTLPGYNPNNYLAFPRETWKNAGVTNSYEPGSIFKPIVASAALDSGLARPNDIFFCENGMLQIGKARIGEAANHKFGWLSLHNIITQSSNIGAVKVAQQLGPTKFYEYIKRFGFGKKMGIDLPGESAGQLKKMKRWSSLSLPSISFGHEIAVTPIQMITAIAAIANGGNLMLPRVTKEIQKNGKTTKTFKPKILQRVISAESSRQMVEILGDVVKSGTGKNAAVPGFAVAGKTGTAQKYDRETMAYSKDFYLSSFVGFAPARNPKLVILVMIDRPKDEYWGGVVAAPVFREISKQVLRYWNIPSGEERVVTLSRTKA